MTTFHTDDRTPHLEPGEVVYANVLNPQQNPRCNGKARPVILLHRRGNGWLVMGLTTLPTYSDGTARTRIDDPAALGLRGPSFLWGTPTRVSGIDILDHNGWVDETTATALAESHPNECNLADLLGETPDGLTAAV